MGHFLNRICLLSIGMIFFGHSAVVAGVRYEGEGLRDPFFTGLPVVSSNDEIKENQSSYVVGGILWSPKAPRIIVNGKRLAEGDSVDGMKIISIDKKGAKIKSGSREGYLTKQGLAWL